MPKIFCADPLCGEEVIPSSPFQRDCIYDGKKWWHVECFKKAFPRRKIDKWLDKTATYLKASDDTTKLEQYIKHTYNLSLIPSSIKWRIQNIADGKYNNFDAKIDEGTLLDMFRYYSSELEQRALYRRNSGIDGMVATSYGEACLRYDLNMLLSKYNEYVSAIAKDQSETDYKYNISTISSPNAIPIQKEQERRFRESGQAAVQRMMDSYWDMQG